MNGHSEGVGPGLASETFVVEDAPPPSGGDGPPSLPSTLRQSSLGALGGIFVAFLVGIVQAWDLWVGPVTYRLVVPLSVAFGVVNTLAAILGAWRGDVWMRRYARGFAVLSLTIPLHYASCAWWGLPMQAAVAGNCMIAAGVLTGIGLAMGHIPTLLGGLAYGLTWVATVLVPELLWLVYALGSGLSFGSFGMAHLILSARPK